MHTVTHFKSTVIPRWILTLTVFLHLCFNNLVYSCFCATGDSPAAGHDAFAKRLGPGAEPTVW